MDEIPIFLGNIQISVKFEITTSQLAQAVILSCTTQILEVPTLIRAKIS